MGINQSSACHAASSCAVIPTSSLSSSGSILDGSVMQPCAAAKVLLLDGRVLHFTSKVRALQVLSCFRNHCLCPLDSVSANLTSSDDSITTFFRPVSLLPGDRLRPGHVYILLPRKMFRLFAAAAAAATRNAGGSGSTSACSGTSSKVCDSSACPSTRAITGSRACNIGPSRSTDAHGASGICDTNATSRDPGIQCGTIAARRIGGSGDGCQIRRIPLQPYQIRAALGSNKPIEPVASANHQLPPQQFLDGSPILNHIHPRRRSLDLHRAGAWQHRRPLGMRRCRSWRPRLQAINEVHVYT